MFHVEQSMTMQPNVTVNADNAINADNAHVTALTDTLAMTVLSVISVMTERIDDNTEGDVPRSDLRIYNYTNLSKPKLQNQNNSITPL